MFFFFSFSVSGSLRVSLPGQVVKVVSTHLSLPVHTRKEFRIKQLFSITLFEKIVKIQEPILNYSSGAIFLAFTTYVILIMALEL